MAVKGKKYRQPDYVCDLVAIPVEDARFDHVVCTQVLEHLPEPLRVIAELGRVLKPGGTLWLSAPLFYAEHEKPYDFFRYTRTAWALLEDAGFEVGEIAWLEGYFGTLSYQVRVAGRALPTGPRDLRRRRARRRHSPARRGSRGSRSARRRPPRRPRRARQGHRRGPAQEPHRGRPQATPAPDSGPAISAQTSTARARKSRKAVEWRRSRCQISPIRRGGRR